MIVFLSIVISFLLSITFTPIVRSFALQWSLVSRPSIDRWAKMPVALYGGIAIYLSVYISSLCVISIINNLYIIYIASSFLFVLGIVDDLIKLKPYHKIIGQLIGSSIVLFFGFNLPWTPSAVLNIGITFLWLVGVTNAINLLDNMDGLAAGVSAISSVFLGLHFYVNDQIDSAIVLFIFASSLCGFLIFNFSPATIFMGDCGSMFIGFFLSSMALVNASNNRFCNSLSEIAAPIFLLLIPIYDTTFVVLLRKLSGRSVSLGGRDHTSHRLVALGLSERASVILLYALSILGGSVALIVHDAPIDLALIIIGIFVLTLSFFSIHLARIKVYNNTNNFLVDMPSIYFLITFSYKCHVYEILIDIVLIILSFYGSNRILFGGVAGCNFDDMLSLLPVIVILKVFAFSIVGIYRGSCLHIGVVNILFYFYGNLLASTLVLPVFIFFFRLSNLSGSFLILDTILLFVFVTFFRASYRFLR